METFESNPKYKDIYFYVQTRKYNLYKNLNEAINSMLEYYCDVDDLVILIPKNDYKHIKKFKHRGISINYTDLEEETNFVIIRKDDYFR